MKYDVSRITNIKSLIRYMDYETALFFMFVYLLYKRLTSK